MSAKTESSFDRLKISWLLASLPICASLRSNHKWTLMTGTASSGSIIVKNFLVSIPCVPSRHASGISFLNICTGTHDTYRSPVTTLDTCTSPVAGSFTPLTLKPPTVPSSLSRILSRGALSITLPPLSSIKSTMGLQSLSGGAPSRKAVLEPSPSCRNLFRAVSTTVALTLSGSTNANALAMAIKISLSMLGGAPRFLSHSEIVMLSHSST
mmetsp:Transcript_56947/g.137694  ORF Transcript_56947/g.137694 Transcript_56947/m.137694 type:complete len:211 (-) Transcript_56947:755-1387(-)